MPATTDTLIFELQVKDSASAVFDAWDKKLESLGKAAVAAGKKIEDAFSASGTAIKTSSKIVEEYPFVLKKVGDAAKAVGVAIKAVFSALGGFILAPFQMAWDFMTGFFSFMKDGFKSAVEFVKDFAIDATKNFLKYEKSLLVVARTTGETWENTKKLGATLLDMALSVGKFAAGGEFEEMGLQAGIAADRLAEIAGIAGQLGKSGEDLIGFVNVVAKMSVATDLSASSAATLLATLGNLFNLDATGIERIASVINELGNTTLATQSQIGEMMRRMSGTAAFLGLSADQVAAYAATMREAGVTVRVGGTAMSQFMSKLMTDGSKMAASLGLDWTSMKATLESNDPSPAIQMVLEKINELAASGGRITVAEKLRDMGITGVGLQDTLLKLSQNTSLLTKNLNAAKEEWAENDSLANEYAATLETAGHKFDTMFSFIDAIKKVVGEDLAQAFGNFTENYLTPLVAKFLEWVKSPPVQKFLEETLPAALEWVGEKIEAVSEFFSDFMANFEDMGAWEAFKQALADVWSAVENMVSGAWNTIKGYISSAWDTITSSVGGRVNEMKMSLKMAWDEIKTTASAAFWEISDTIVDALSNVGETIGDIFGNEAELAFGEFTDFLANIPHMIQAVVDELSRLMPSINEIVDGMVQAVNLFKDIKGGIEEFELDIGGGLLDSLDAVTAGFNEMVGLGALNMDGTTKAVEDTTKAIDDMTDATKAANEALNKYGNDAYENSVWPDTTSWVNKTTDSLKSLSSMTASANAAQVALGSSASNALSNLTTGYADLAQSYSEYSSAKSLESVGSASSSSASSGTSSTASASTDSSATSVSTPSSTTVIQFSGTNVIDESSKERFLREIMVAQTNISSNTVSA